MKMMPPDVISHENQLQHLSEPLIFMLDVFRTADHAGQIFIPHRPSEQVKNTRNFFCMTEILLMNLSFIQLSTNLQLITMRNSSSGKNIKSPWAPAGFFQGVQTQRLVNMYVQRLRDISVYSVYLWNTNTCCSISLCRNRLCQTLCIINIL